MLFSMLFYLFSNPIMGFFTQTAAIKRIAKTLFLIDIATCMGRALNHSYNYGLRSAGYVFWPVLFACASMLLIQVGVGCILAFPLKLGIFGIWLAQALDEWVGACLRQLYGTEEIGSKPHRTPAAGAFCSGKSYRYPVLLFRFGAGPGR